MDDLHLTSYDFEDKQPPSLADHLRDSAKEVFASSPKHKSGEDSILPAVVAGAALSLAAIVGWKKIAQKFVQKAEENATRSENLALGEFANLAKQKTKLELDPSFRYFHQTRGDVPQIYRMPDNGLSLEKQPLSAVERYSNGVWKANKREDLIHELARGWFHEKKDEISVQRAMELLSR